MLTDLQQYRLVSTALALDAIGVYHNDPNPLNMMCTDGRFYYIDFGMTKPIDTKKNGRFPNTRALRTTFTGGMQGLITRGVYTGDASIILKYSEMAGSNPAELHTDIPTINERAYPTAGR